MTAYGTPEITREALQLGACEVLLKPFDIDHLPVIDAKICDAATPRPRIGSPRDTHSAGNGFTGQTAIPTVES